MKMTVYKIGKWLLKLASYALILLPRKNTVIFIGPGYDKYKDNVRAAFELAANDLSSYGINCYWISDSEEVSKLIESVGLSSIPKRSFRTVYKFITSRYIISGETAPPTIYGFHNFSCVHICVSHGFGPRSTVIADGEIYRSNSSVRKSINKFSYYLFPNKYMALMLGRMQYDISDKKMFISQQPRLSPDYVNNSQLHIDKTRKNIFYCPTWRQNGLSPFDILTSEISVEELDELLSQFECVLWISAHPLVSEVSGLYSPANIYYIDPLIEDPSQFIRVCDFVLTDYSSLITDAVFWRKPVYLYCPDLDYYQYRYGLNVYLKHELDPACFIDNIEDLFYKIKNHRIQDNNKYYEKFCASEVESSFKENLVNILVNSKGKCR